MTGNSNIKWGSNCVYMNAHIYKRQPFSLGCQGNCHRGSTRRKGRPVTELSCGRTSPDELPCAPSRTCHNRSARTTKDTS